MRSKTKILLVEDDYNLSLVLKDYLDMLGYETTIAKDGEEGLQKFQAENFDMCIIDVMMPRKDGFSLAKDIRKFNSDVPMIFLTAKTMKEDRIKGFKVGADDYLTKPFSTEELSLRIEVILKRCQIKNLYASYTEERAPFTFGIFHFDHNNMLLKSEHTEQKLTKKEADLLKLLYVNRNNLLSREMILKSIWGDDDYFIGRSMDVFIAKLRKYLKPDPNISIVNIHGTGFKLEIKEPEA